MDKIYKRQTREVSQETRQKISNALKGRTQSPQTRQKISDGQKAAWAKIPQKQSFDILWPSNENKD